MPELWVVCDLAVAISCIAISATLCRLIWRVRQEVPFSSVFLAAGVLILACGAAYFMEVWTPRTMVKVATAMSSLATAILVLSLAPKALALIESTKAHKEGLRQIAAILDNSIEAIISLDLDYQITSWNRAAERIFGYPASDVLGKPISILAPTGLETETAEAIKRYMEGQGPSSFETVRVRKNGDRIDVNEILSLITDGAGVIRGISVVKRDVSEQKRGEEILRVAVEAAPNGVVMADQAGKIRLVNAQTERMFGYTRQELLGQSVDILVPDRFRRGHPAARGEFMGNPHARSMGAGRDLYGLRKDKSEFPVEIGLNPIRISGETWVLSAILDITERHRAQQEITQLNRELESRVEGRTSKLFTANLELLREISERKLRELDIGKLNTEMKALVDRRTAELEVAHEGFLQVTRILDNSVEAILTVALDSVITGWNKAAEQMFGYPANEVLGRSISILAPPELVAETWDAIAQYVKGQGPSSFETVRVRKNGEKLDVRLMLSLITDGRGEIQGVSLVERDITERKLGYEILRVAADAGPSAMVMADQTGKIILVNAQTEKMFGYLREELLGQSVDMLTPARYRHAHPGVRAEFMKHPEARAMGAGRDLYAVRKDGKEFPVEIGLNPIRMSGETWVLSAIVDITERKRAQQDILRLNEDLERRVNERTQELSHANAELEAFSYTVAHDLRAPLRHIAGFANILAVEFGGELSAEAKGHLESVQSGAQSMGNLIDALLHLAKIGRQAVSRKPTRLNVLVESALAGLAPERLEREIEWNIEDLGSADCDPSLMRQVFVNLLSNAVKYTRLQKVAHIEVARTTVDGEPVFFVSDDGAGFDMQYAGNLFGVFHRLHKAREFEGTGVGLATVQRIIRNHGGRVWAQAQVGKGATFSFTIPGAIQEVSTRKMEEA